MFDFGELAKLLGAVVVGVGALVGAIIGLVKFFRSRR